MVESIGALTDVRAVGALQKYSVREPIRAITAFSLVELLIVVAIIGVIAAIAIPRFASGHERSRLVAFIQNCRSIEAAAQRYALENNGEYPSDETEGIAGVLVWELRGAGNIAFPDPGDPGVTMDWNGEGGANTWAGPGRGYNFVMQSPNWTPEFLAAFDREADDGNPNTGRVLIRPGEIVWYVE